MSDEKALHPPAAMTFLTAVTLWVTAAILLVLIPQGGRAWIAWAIGFVLILLLVGMVEALTTRSRRKPPAATHTVLSSAQGTLAEAARIRADIETNNNRKDN